jgi:hypothetical protein
MIAHFQRKIVLPKNINERKMNIGNIGTTDFRPWGDSIWQHTPLADITNIKLGLMTSKAVSKSI